MPRKKKIAKKVTTKKIIKKKVVKKSQKKAVVKKRGIKSYTKNKTVKVIDPDLNKEKKVRGHNYTTLRGMRDILPKEGKEWQHIYNTAQNIANAYGFVYSETPVLEQAQLFIRSIGKGTDVVDKEMYIFEDRDGSKVCLRPEMTASMVRAYNNHGLHTMIQPVKVWYWGPMFRHDRPQAGRYRQFHHFGCETIGEKSPVVDAELISVAYNMLLDLGIESTVRINSIGISEDRENYIVELVGYLRSKRSYLSDDSKKRINKNPLRILDSKHEQDQAVLEEAPQIIDWLSEPSKKFFTEVLEYLDEANVPYVLTPTLVRGLDYYTDTVFELYADDEEEKSQSALGGGGRYDGLAEQLGGQSTPGSGFSLGIERIFQLLKQRKDKEEKKEGYKEKKPGGIFFAQLGEQARKRSLYLIEKLRRDGLIVHHILAKSALKTQLEIANKLGVLNTLILGQKEVQDETILIRNMESGIQEVIDQKKINNTVRKLLGK